MKCILCGMNFEYSARTVHDPFIDHHEDKQTGMTEYIIALHKKMEDLEHRMQQFHGLPDI
jgi:hypothetical protein